MIGDAITDILIFIVAIPFKLVIYLMVFSPIILPCLIGWHTLKRMKGRVLK